MYTMAKAALENDGTIVKQAHPHLCMKSIVIILQFHCDDIKNDCNGFCLRS